MNPSLTQPTPLTRRPQDLDPNGLPAHVAVIMDGNGRWANRQGLPRVAGHRQGARRVKDLVRCCKDWGIPVLTVYAFSTENWRRPSTEVDFLMALFERLLQKELAELHREGVQVQFLGDLSVMPSSLREVMENAMALTHSNSAVQFNVAVNYGSRHELLRACQQVAERVHRGELHPDDLREDTVTQFLYAPQTPDPDLLIRTSGEQRLSNFLLWQLAYAELYFTDILWPDFDRSAFHQALLEYQRRDRRFGTVKTAQLA